MRPSSAPDPLAERETPDHAADLALRDAAVAGDRGAAETLFRRHFDGLYDFVHYRVGGDRQAAEDLVQETLLTALDRLPSYDGRASLQTWLAGIARNKLREHRRRRRPRPLADVLLDADEEILDVLARIDAEPLPEWALAREETREMVGATLSSLPAEYRDALTAKYVDGLSVREIGERSGRSEKAAESLLTRARRAFGEVLGLLARRSGGDPGDLL
ncbi:MAG: RNA polymerase sigma factor [Planctomycetota bacterium]